MYIHKIVRVLGNLEDFVMMMKYDGLKTGGKRRYQEELHKEFLKRIVNGRAEIARAEDTFVKSWGKVAQTYGRARQGLLPAKDIKALSNLELSFGVQPAETPAPAWSP